MRQLILVLSAVAMFSCGPAAPKLSDIETTIFTPKCANAGCHTANVPAQGLNLVGSTYARLVGVSSTLVTTKKLVVAGDTSSSFLYEKVLAATPTAGARMPSTGPLSAADIEMIRAWIAAGASND